MAARSLVGLVFELTGVSGRNESMWLITPPTLRKGSCLLGALAPVCGRDLPQTSQARGEVRDVHRAAETGASLATMPRSEPGAEQGEASEVHTLLCVYALILKPAPAVLIAAVQTLQRTLKRRNLLQARIYDGTCSRPLPSKMPLMPASNV